MDPLANNAALAEGEGQERVQDLPKVMVPRGAGATATPTRRVLITRECLKTFGYTAGCAQCAAL